MDVRVHVMCVCVCVCVCVCACTFYMCLLHVSPQCSKFGSVGPLVHFGVFVYIPGLRW